jgi:hypothetical protein
MNGPLDTSDLDEVLDTLAELEDEDLDRISPASATSPAAPTPASST